MTFEIEGEMILQSGRYKIVQIEAGNQVKNNLGLDDVARQSEQLVCNGCVDEKQCKETNACLKDEGWDENLAN